MVRIVILLLFTVTLSSAEIVTRAYYIGKHEPRDWRLIAAMEGHQKKIDSAPFQSPHFRNGDTLVDMQDYWKKVSHSEADLRHAIYNPSTGYLVLRGNHVAQAAGKALLHQMMAHFPVNISINLEFFEEADGDESKLLEMTTLLSPGPVNEMIVGSGPHQISLKAETAFDRHSDHIELRLNLEGRIRGKAISLNSCPTILNDTSRIIFLGKERSEEETLFLRLSSQKLSDGSIATEDLILDEKAHPIEIVRSLSADRKELHKGIKNEKSGKFLRAFAVPQNIADFLRISDNGNNGVLSEDPFSDASVDTIPSADTDSLPIVTSWDSRLPAAPYALVVDFSGILEDQGIRLEDDDFAVLDQDINILFVSADEVQMELMEAIVQTIGPDESRMIQVDIHLFEGEINSKQIPLADLINHASKSIGTLVGPGLCSKIELGGFKAEIEASIDQNDEIVEVLSLIEVQDGEDFQSLKTGAILVPEVPTMIHTAQIEGRRHTVIMTAQIIVTKSK